MQRIPIMQIYAFDENMFERLSRCHITAIIGRYREALQKPLNPLQVGHFTGEHNLFQRYGETCSRALQHSLLTGPAIIKKFEVFFVISAIEI